MIGKLQTFVHKYRNRRNFRQNLQEEYDWERVSESVRFRANFRSQQARLPHQFTLQALKEKTIPEADLKALYESEKTKLEVPVDRMDAVLRQLDPQMFDLFEHIQQQGGENPYPKPVFRKKPSDPPSAPDEDDSDTDLYINRKMNLTDVETFNPGVEIVHPDGFGLSVRKSAIGHPESGYGVHLTGVALPGTILAIYPGTVYFPHNLTPEVCKDNEYMISRYDGVVVNGKGWDRKAERAAKTVAAVAYTTPGAYKSTAVRLNLKKFRNPFGIGQYINHPPAGSQANVLCVAYDFPTDTPSEFREYIPNEYSIPPPMVYRRFNTAMHSIIAIATRPVIDEELFLNYRYNPSHPYPEWYTQPDLEAAKRRWAPPKFF